MDVWFEWGADAGYGSETPPRRLSSATTFGFGGGWYESRNDDPSLLTLHTTPLVGDASAKAAFAPSLQGSAYLSPELGVAAGNQLSVAWDILVDSILDLDTRDRAATMMLGDDSDGKNGPNSTNAERFVLLAFYMPGGGGSGEMSLIARESDDPWDDSSQWRSIASGLSLDAWHTVRVDCDLAAGTYDVWVNGALLAAAVRACSPKGALTHVSFAQLAGGPGAFFVDDVRGRGPTPALVIDRSFAASGSSEELRAVEPGLTGLRPGTTYHFRARASGATGVVAGDDMMFTTAPSPCQLRCGARPPASAQAGVPVSFSAEVWPEACVGSIAYDWDFGDAAPHSQEWNPTHQYESAGRHHWVLAASADGTGCTTAGDITVTAACALGCSAIVPQYATVGGEVPFASTVTTSNCSSPVTLDWDLGDGTPHSQAPDPSHVYATTGTFGWTLQASADGKECTASGNIVVGQGWCQGEYDLIIPAAAHTPGLLGSYWISDVDFLNVDVEHDARVDIAALLANRSNLDPDIAAVTAPPGRALRLGDVLGTLLPAANAALGVRFCDGGVLANSRFFNTAKGAGTTYGMYIPAMGQGEALAAGQVGFFHHLSYSPDDGSGARTNIGFANGTPFPVDVVIRLFGDMGELLETLRTRLRAYEHRQYTRIHKSLGTPAVASGFATVEVATPGGRVHACAMLIENVSGDPIYMPVKVVTPPPAQ